MDAFEAIDETPPETPPETPLRTRSVVFASQDIQLEGVLHLPEAPEGAPLVVGVHGLFSSAESPKQIALGQALAERGIGFFRFSHRGCGNSAGEFGRVTTFEGRCADLIDAVFAARKEADFGPTLGLFGSSLGGTVCLATGRSLGASAVVALAAPLRSAVIRRVLEEGDPAEADIPEWNPDAMAFDATEKANGLGNLLILHGDCDRVVTPSEAFRIYQLARMPKRLIMIRNGDHRLSGEECQEKFLRETVNWFANTFRDIPRR